MFETHLRQAANVVLESAISFAPPDVREWGQAMKGELDYVDGGWASVIWALGGATVLAKQALIALFMPGRRSQPVPAGNGLFTRSISLRKVALVAGAAYVLGALIFFAAPPFRQGLRVSLAAWNQVFQVGGSSGQPRLAALIKRAEKLRDPEGLAFAAVRVSDSAECGRLADEAVRRDPVLLWVYALVAARHPDPAEIERWVPELESWDPQNAFLPLVAAEGIDISRTLAPSGRSPNTSPDSSGTDQAWQKTMTAAFASPKFDDYLDRLRTLDRDVVTRYGFNDPYSVLSAEEEALPIFASADSRQFAKSILLSGDKLKARGDLEGASAKYWAVAQFGQLIDSEARTGLERWTGTALQGMAYKQLESLADRNGTTGEAHLFGYLAAKVDPAKGETAWLQEEGVFGHYIARRNAAVLQISGLAMILFAGLMVIGSAFLISRRRRGIEPGAWRAWPIATSVALTSSVGLLLSSATIYLTYRPYWYIFERAMLTGDMSQTPDLRDFLISAETLPGAALRGEVATYLPVYFWALVISLGLIGLILILLRHVRGRTGTHRLEQSPRVT